MEQVGLETDNGSCVKEHAYVNSFVLGMGSETKVIRIGSIPAIAG